MIDFYKDKDLILLNGKVPVEKGSWVLRKYDDDVVLSHNGNLGWVIGDKFVVVDIDPRNGGDESMLKLPIDLVSSIKTQGGGLHCYYSIANPTHLRKTMKEYPGIDIITGNKYVCIPYKDNGYDIVGQLNKLPVFPESLLEIYAPRESIPKGDVINKYTPDQVNMYLSKCSPDEYNFWIETGMGLKGFYTNLKLSDQGLRVWKEWSKRSSKYNESVCDEKWRTFEPKHISIDNRVEAFLGVTEASLQEVTKYIDEIDQITDVNALQEKLDNFNMTVDAIAQIRIVGKYIERFKVFGVKLTTANIKSKVRSYMESETSVSIKQAALKDWVYIQSRGQYYNKSNGVLTNCEGFENECTQFVPIQANGKPYGGARAYMRSTGKLKSYAGLQYIPSTVEPVVLVPGDNGGVQAMLNTYSPHSHPSAVSITPECREYIKVLEQVIRVLCNYNAEHTALTLDYLAHTVKKPGDKVTWAMLFRSCPGMGKTYLKELMSAVIGERNVRVISLQQLESKYNGFTEGACFGVFEELDVNQHDSPTILNILKPIVANKTVSINEKYQVSREVPNTMNYILFSNDKSPISLESNDRRYVVMSCKANSPKDICDGTKFSHYRDLFDYLYGNLEKYKGMLRTYFLEREPGELFVRTHKSEAIMTEGKSELQARKRVIDDHHDKVADIIERTKPYIHPEIVSLEALQDEYDTEGKHRRVRASLVRCLGMLQYTQYTTRVKIKGSRHNVFHKFSSDWVKLTTDKARNRYIRDRFKELNENYEQNKNKPQKDLTDDED